MVYVHRQDDDTVRLRVADELSGSVKAHRLTVEQGRGEGSREVAFQPGADIGQEGKAGCVRLRKAVFSKAADLFV